MLQAVQAGHSAVESHTTLTHRPYLPPWTLTRQMIHQSSQWSARRPKHSLIRLRFFVLTKKCSRHIDVRLRRWRTLPPIRAKFMRRSAINPNVTGVTAAGGCIRTRGIKSSKPEEKARCPCSDWVEQLQLCRPLKSTRIVSAPSREIPAGQAKREFLRCGDDAL